MASIFTEGFEGGADGVAISTANSGFNSVDAGWTFAASPVAVGSRSGKITAAAATSIVATKTFTAKPQVYRRFYVRLSAYPTGTGAVYHLTISRSGSTNQGQLRVNAAGQLVIRDGSTTAWTSTNPLPLDQWIRVEWLMDAANQKQQVKLFYGANPHSVTPTEDSNLVAMASATGTTTEIRMGLATNSSTVGTLAYFDAVADDDATWPGTAVVVIPSGTAEAPWSVTLDVGGTIEERFEVGAHGEPVTSTLAPFFNTVDPGFTITNSPAAAQGGKSAQLDVEASALRMMTRVHGGSVSKRFYRFYMRMPAYPGNANGIFNMRNSSAVLANVRMSTSGSLVLRDGGTARYTSPAMPIDEWFRVEIMIDNAANKLRLRAFTAQNIHGTVPDLDSGDQVLTVGGTDRFTIGCDNGAVGPWTVFYDGVAESPVNWVGPTTSNPNPNPIFIWSEDFENGVDGEQILADDTAFTSVDENWVYVDFPKPPKGNLAAQLTVAVDETSMLRRSRAAAPLYYFRYYLYLPTYAASSNGITFLKAGNTSILTVRATPAGQLALRDGSTTRWTSTALPRHQWVRVEGMADSVNHKTQIKLFVGTNLHGTVPDQDSGLQTLTNSNPSSITFGCDNGSVSDWTLLFDEFGESTTDWVGPVGGGSAQLRAAHATWLVTMAAEGRFNIPTTKSLLTRTKVTPTGTFPLKQVYTPAAKTTFDMRGARYEGYFWADSIFGFKTFSDGAGGNTATPHQRNNVPFEIGSKAAPASDLAIVGGVVIGDQDVNLTWEQMKHGSPVQDALDAGMDPAEVYSTVRIGNQNQDGDPRLHLAKGSWAIIDALRVDNTHDGFGLYGQTENINNDTGKVYFRNVWVKRCHDNAIENDVSYLSIDVNDCLFEDVFSFISVRAGITTGVPDIAKTQRVRSCIVSLWPRRGPHKQPSSVSKHGHIYKMQTNSPGFQVSDTIFAATDYAVSSNAQLPERPGLDSYENVTIVWLGSGAYPGNVPAGCTLTTNASVLTNAIARWKQRHGVTNFDNVDMAKMIEPAMGARVGSSPIGGVRLGGSTVSRIYAGASQVWP